MRLLSCLIAVITTPLVLAQGIAEQYPTTVPVFEVRKHSDGTPVRSGLLPQVVDLPENCGHFKEYRRPDSKIYTRAEFKDALQCAPTEPDLDEHMGSISMIEEIPVTRDTVEIMAVWGETRCDSWLTCQKNLNDVFRPEKMGDRFGMNSFNGFEEFRMLRTINGQLHDDWPFHRDRIDKQDNVDPQGSIGRMRYNYLLLELVAGRVSDLPNTVFFIGQEQSFLPWNIPFPAFAPSAKLTSNTIPWPWPDSVHVLYNNYWHFVDRKLDINNQTLFAELTHQLPWDEREARCAYFGTWSDIRIFAYEAARQAPDLFDVSFTFAGNSVIKPLNPTSPEQGVTFAERDAVYQEQQNNGEIKRNKDAANKVKENNHISPRAWTKTTLQNPGYAKPLVAFADGRHYQPGHYKYVVVMLAMTGTASAQRLAELFALSGAVILIQESQFRWHFSARLKPWVHYVPISYSGADLVRKVAWLKAHDDLARQIAENGRNFARSYLRLEDHLCYALHAVEAIAGGMTPSALESFHPKLISGQNCIG